MIVSKFGGTSVGDAAAIRRLAAIVAGRRAAHPVVVVSALAKITDRLLALAGTDEPEAFDAALAAIVDRHAAIAAELDLPPAVLDRIRQDADSLRQWIRARGTGPWDPAEQDQLVAHGELWSSRLVAAALERHGVSAVWVDARHVIITEPDFTQAPPKLPAIRNRAARVIEPILAQGGVPVTQGFIGATQDGRTTTLGRGGSDYTASLLGAALGAERVEIWTDVDGVLTADPRIVPAARLLPEASYLEAAELAAFGAKVLHPATQLPLIDAGIPCWVLNSFAPERPGTRIVPDADPAPLGDSPVRAIAWKKGVTVVNVRAPRRLGAVEFLQQLFAVFARHGVAVDVLASSEVNVSVTVDDPTRLAALADDLAPLGTVTLFEGRAIVAVVGTDLRGTKGLVSRVFHAVRHVNIEVISQGASEINVTFVVAEADGVAAVRALHREFFEA